MPYCIAITMESRSSLKNTPTMTDILNIRNWLRSTMGQKRFSSLALLNIGWDPTAALVPVHQVLMYANSGTRRLLLHRPAERGGQAGQKPRGPATFRGPGWA